MALDNQDIEVEENKMALDNLSEGFRLFKTACDFFNDTDFDISTETKANVDKQSVLYRNIFR